MLFSTTVNNRLGFTNPHILADLILWCAEEQTLLKLQKALTLGIKIEVFFVLSTWLFTKAVFEGVFYQSDMSLLEWIVVTIIQVKLNSAYPSLVWVHAIRMSQGFLLLNILQQGTPSVGFLACISTLWWMKSSKIKFK